MQNAQLRLGVVHFAPPAGGLWNALGAQDRPCYKETVGRGLYIRPCAPPRRTHPRPTPTAAGGLPCTQKLAGRCGHRPLREERKRVRRGGLYIRPCAPPRRDAPPPYARSGRWTALHAEEHRGVASWRSSPGRAVRPDGNRAFMIRAGEIFGKRTEFARNFFQAYSAFARKPV